MKCNLCPRLCNAERGLNFNNGGYCGAPENLRLARAALHYWEEPSICGENGSGTVFFSGCSLSCIYCQNVEISQNNKGKEVTAKRLSEIFYELEKKKANNINLVSPTHYLHKIIEALDIYRPKIPIVYNSSGFERAEVLRSIEKYIDIYLMDFKYFSPQKASDYSKAANYTEVVKAALKEAYRQKGECVFDQRGIMQKGVIVRHLLLPQATNEAIKIFDWVNQNMPNAYFSLMAQYIPLGEALNDKYINRPITKREYEKVVDYILDRGFENCYIQELASAKKDYIPDFDFSGI